MRRPPAQNQIDKTVSRRLDTLERLIDAEYEGKPSLFEQRTGIKMTQLNQWFTGYRALRDKALRRLEEQTGKPEGFFDNFGGLLGPEPVVEQRDPPAERPGEASATAMEIALLFDLIPAADRIRRTKAYNAATAAILAVLEEKPATE